MSMFSIGLSGLNAAQNALNTSSNNISNVYTPGYNRELAQLGEGRVGGGVRVNDIERQFNTYVADQLNSAKTQSSALNTYYSQVTQIDNLLADRAAGLAPLMQNFFSSLEDLAASPSDPAARQGVLGQANTLSSQFRSFDGYLQDMQGNINGQIKDEITQINNTTEQIAGLNKEIALARARSGEAPNSLLNQRDQLVSELNERMDLRLNIQDGKTYNISLPNGQPLVTGTNSFQLEAVQADYDPQRTVVGYRDGGGNVVQLDESTITGGALGGLMSFRSETLDKTQNQIGQLAVSLATAFNEQHKQGVDLNGDQGEDFFAVRAPQTYADKNNSLPAVNITSAEFNPDQVDALRATDYTVSFEAGEPVVTRKDNGQVVDFDQDAWDDDGELNFGGVSIEFSGVPQDGDRFEIQPVRRAANGMDTNIADVDKIAAGDAGFINVGNNTGNSFEREGDLNVSDLGISSDAFADNRKYQFEVDSDGSLTLTPAVNIMVNGTNVDASDLSDVELEAGDEIEVDGISFTVDALPDAGETSSLTVSQTIFTSGDNRNALALQDLQSQSIVGASATVTGAYASIVSDVGNRTNITEVNLDARQGLTDQLRAVQQSESGVNLDEEAANLIRYQQYYQANARVIDTAGTLMDTILNLRG
ncbi:MULTISPECIES: flagellar hook-associated protein FlgK [Halomonadaceae]|uniref:flagellar hook-associated protein FlgK n=1 Tax=Halomonadaceae TaxID=28256 RepID=UPI0012F4102F|nr:MULTISPECIES: flagellar hook-associated protein FlgK [Halomonas]CAD5246337.1 Flagellar hook-associated protein flgK [Halomonas sp. I3]CAD5267906.1 Flagellar hook-associated protein FlgK [Halomonas sp. 113]CAD5269836.1 Flagellar hook-associated protein FlgK [Halomonas sp. 59]CAD5283769.1 Flagellar hook-associated protein FlgK [Halomonas sp. 156]VXA94163.1 Flagellar hook-associated protein FlgK [Halomonas titanicae]